MREDGGMRAEDGWQFDPDVTVTFGDWSDFGGVRLFRTASFLQGEEVYTHRYTTIEWNGVADTTFLTPLRHTD